METVRSSQRDNAQVLPHYSQASNQRVSRVKVILLRDQSSLT